MTRCRCCDAIVPTTTGECDNPRCNREYLIALGWTHCHMDGDGCEPSGADRDDGGPTTEGSFTSWLVPASWTTSGRSTPSAD
jgi:hypothetical protein